MQHLDTVPGSSSLNDAAIRVLLVEDNPQDVELLQAALAKKLAVHLRVAQTRATFEAELDQQLPDIIVSDSNVITFDGLAALKLAQDKCPDIPFVFCSGELSEGKQEEALARGAAGWASKDDSFAQLICVIRRFCAWRRP